SRLLLYQAKLGGRSPRRTAGGLDLKSPVPPEQAELLRKVAVEVDDTTYAVTGRLAIYQTAYLAHMHASAGITWPHGLLRSWAAKPPKAVAYYNTILRPHSYSPCGVMAAAVPPGKAPIKNVPEMAIWPWEFDTYHWL